MRETLGGKATVLALVIGWSALGAGCGLLDVEMTSSPEVVRHGDPVTFDVKLTNASQCPVKEASAVVAAFLPISEFDFFGALEVPPGVEVPPEIIALLTELDAFFDELCSGGDPELPEFPETAKGPGVAMGCRRGAGELVCEATGPVTAQQTGGGSMTFATFGDRLRCEMDAGTMSCRFRIALPVGQTAGGGPSAALASQDLTCLTVEELAAELGVPPEDLAGEESLAFCFVGTDFMNPGGLDPGEMATGQVSLPARGSGPVRNLIFANGTDDEGAGVCKAGANAGQACDQGESGGCPGSSCGDGICDGGGNDGKGCDEATAAADCPGGTCVLCAELPAMGFLPLDCTETRISAKPVPTASPWGLAALAAVLFAGGSFWLHRRRRA